MTADNDASDGDLVGVIPLAGAANRISPLPLSKELFPIGFGAYGPDGEARAKPVCLYLLEQMRRGGVTRAFLVLRPGKWDVPAYLQDGSLVGLALSYLVMPHGYGVPYTVDQATPFVRGARIAFGYPDIIIEARDDVFACIAAEQRRTGADMVLAAFRSDDPENWGMIDFDADFRVHRTVEKPGRTHMTYTWGAAVWTPAFTRFLHHRLAELRPEVAARSAAGVGTEVQIADIIQAAIHHGLVVRALPFAEGSLRDVGRPQTLIQAVRDFAARQP
jgi:glucose-1-phosphate thymidylyltransferase